MEYEKSTCSNATCLPVGKVYRVHATMREMRKRNIRDFVIGWLVCRG